MCSAPLLSVVHSFASLYVAKVLAAWIPWPSRYSYWNGRQTVQHHLHSVDFNDSGGSSRRDEFPSGIGAKKNSLHLPCQVGTKLRRTASATEPGSLKLILQMQRLRTQGNPRMYAASNELHSLEGPRHHIDRSQK